jgi:hypothetical protein
VVADLEVVEMSTHEGGPGGVRRIAYFGVVVGLAVSIAANVAHGFVPPPGWPADKPWTPEPGAVAGAMFWPVALLLTTEILARKKWPAGWVWLVVRLVGLLPVAVVAAVISYQHLHGLLLHYYETPLAAAIGPLSIDGLMVMASAALIAPDRDDPAPLSSQAAPDASANQADPSSASPREGSSASPPEGSSSSSASSSPTSSREGSSPSSSQGSPSRPTRRASSGPGRSSGSPASGSSGTRADDETLRALVVRARAERPGAGEPAVRRLLTEAGLSASAARVRAALAATGPDQGSSADGPDHDVDDGQAGEVAA